MSLTKYFGRLFNAVFGVDESVEISERRYIEYIFHAADVDLKAIRSHLPHMMTSYQLGNHRVKIMKPEQIDTALYNIRAIALEDVQRLRSDQKILDFESLPQSKQVLFAKHLKNLSIKNIRPYYDPELFHLDFKISQVMRLKEYDQKDKKVVSVIPSKRDKKIVRIKNIKPKNPPVIYLQGNFYATPRDSHRHSGLYTSEVRDRVTGIPVKALFDIPLYRVNEVFEKYGEDGSGLEKLV